MLLGHFLPNPFISPFSNAKKTYSHTNNNNNNNKKSKKKKEITDLYVFCILRKYMRNTYHFL